MIPIADPDVSDLEKARVNEVIDDGQIADGPVVRQFESEFAGYCGTDHGVATANGTTALHAALEAADIGPGDRVLTTPFSFIATANVIRFAGAEPVFADVDPATLTLDPYTVEATLRRHDDIAAMLVVHLYGRPAAMDHLTDIATDYDVLLIEDAAQAHGAELDGQRVGSFGDAACFSFYPTKNMTTGEGGMIVTDREDVAEEAARFVNHGRVGSYTHASVGHNFRMTSIAAAIGRVQLERLPGFTRARRRNAERYSAMLAETPVTTPSPVTGGRHVYHQYTIRYDDRDGLAASLEDEGIGTSVYYPIPIHRQRPYEDVDASAPVADRAAETVLSLPVHPNVSEEELTAVADAVIEYTGERG